MSSYNKLARRTLLSFLMTLDEFYIWQSRVTTLAPGQTSHKRTRIEYRLRFTYAFASQPCQQNYMALGLETK